MTEFLPAVRAQRVLPVLRTDDADAAAARVAQLLAAGCRVVELTTTIPDWSRTLARVAAGAGADAIVGLGTVTTAEQARGAVEIGAKFLVSPYAVPDVRAVADALGVPFLEGAFTPTELAKAAAYGPVKLFPAHAGGPAYLASVRTVLPAADIIPTGGVRLADVDAYLRAGAAAVGVGSGLPDDSATLEELFS